MLQASVHRPRHVAIKRNENSTAAGNSHATNNAATNGGTIAAINMQQHTAGNNALALQRPTYQQYQQQRRIQFQQQHQQHQQQQQQQDLQKQMQMHLQQQPYQVVQVENAQMNGQLQYQQQKKPKSTFHEMQLQQQQQQQQQLQMQQHVMNHGPYLPNAMTNTNGVTNRLSVSQIQQLQQQQHSNKSRIPVQHQKITIPRQQLQHQQQQQQQLHQQTSFNQISKNATNLLNDIYERNLLNQTTFIDKEQQQQQLQFAAQHLQQQQKIISRAQISLPSQLQNSNGLWLHKTTKAQIHSMKLPAPPQTEQQTLFQLSDSYVDPVDTKKHFLLDAHNHQPPPPPAPLNHVYETIKERPPMPPPPPERNQNSQQPPPPLPPSRLLKKKLMAAAASNSRPYKSHKKTSHEKDGETKAHNKMLHIQPPAYIAPPPLVANAISKTPAQYPYSLQQRTKADGEHRSILYQQLREQNLKQQQQIQQSRTTATNDGNEKEQQQQQQQQGEATTGNKHLNNKQQQQCTREHPLGAHDEKLSNVSSTTTQNNNNNNNNITSSSNVTSVAGCAIVTCEDLPLDEHDVPLSVEHTLQQAGLLPTNTSSTSVPINNMNNSNSNNNYNNNNNRHNRPSALPIVFEEDTGEFQDVLVLENDGTAKLPYRHGKKIEVSLETAQAMAAAAYYAR